MAESEKKLYRLPKEGMIAGVAAGLAKYFDMDVTMMRLIFVAVALLSSGGAVIAYLILAVVMPTPEGASEKASDIGQKFENLVEEVSENGRAKRAANYIGIGLVVFGAWLLLGQLYPDWFSLPWTLLWPVLVIVLGVLMITRSKKS